MPLIQNTYGKGRVRIMRVKRDSERHEVRELTVQAMLTGAFEASYTEGDNASVIATDSIKNIVNIVARDHVGAENEDYAGKLAGYFLDHYAHVEKVDIFASETRWARLAVDGAPHAHSFTARCQWPAVREAQRRRAPAPRSAPASRASPS